MGEVKGLTEGGEGTHRGRGRDPQGEGKGPTGGGEEAFPPLTTVQLHMLLQVFLKVEGLPTGRLWAGEGLLVDVLVLLVVLGEEAHGFLRATTRADPAAGSSALSHNSSPCHRQLISSWPVLTYT